MCQALCQWAASCVRMSLKGHGAEFMAGLLGRLIYSNGTNRFSKEIAGIPSQFRHIVFVMCAVLCYFYGKVPGGHRQDPPLVRVLPAEVLHCEQGIPGRGCQGG